MSEMPPNPSQQTAGMPASNPAGGIAPGTVLGGTYRIEEPLGTGGLGALFLAVDTRSEIPVAIRILSPELTSDPAVVQALEEQIPSLQALEHKNLVRTYGMANEQGTYFLVTEYVAGQPLRAVIDRKQRSRRPFTLKGAYNIVAHLCNACGYAHETTFHGALNPGNVLVSRAGRIKIADFGLARALGGMGSFEAVQGHNGYQYLAPEMTQDPAAADERADIYAIGVILNELLTGRSPGETFETPSSVRPGLPVEVDQVIGRCMRPVPDERFDTIQELKLALMGALEGASDVPAAETSAPVEVEVDIDMDLDAPAPAVAGRGLPGLPPAPAAQGDPFEAGGNGEGVSSVGMGDAFDLESLITGATGEEEEKYLISKKGLDFGPFSLVEVKRQIASGDIQPGDNVVEQDTGKRSKIKSHPLLKDFTKEVIRRKEAQRRAIAESATETVERRKRRVLIAGVVAAVGVIGLVVGSVLIYQGITRQKKGPTARAGDELSYQGSEEDPEKKGRGKRRYRGRRGRHGSTGLNKRINAVDSFDFAGSGGGGGEKLDPSVIRSVIDKRKNRVGGCMMSAGAKSISVFVQVRGNGSLAYVSAKPKSATGCVRRALSGLRFPKFAGKVTQGHYHLSL